MATITTKFNIGEKAYTIERKTMKITEFVVSRIWVYVAGEEKPSVSYIPEGSEYSSMTYDEDLCFATKEELMEYISQ